MKRILLFVLTAILMLSILSGCGYTGRDYKDDICILLEDRDAVIIVREWSFLLGSGAEIYYEKNGKTTQLGQTSGGDDGYCPIEDGKWSYSIEGNTLIIKWAFRGSDEKENWKEQVFTLPG